MALTTPQYWDALRHGRGPIPDYTFHRLLTRYLPRNPALRLIELGCVPGDFLLYFSREFDYRISGLDWSPTIGEVERFLASAGAAIESFYQVDFMRHEPVTQYDIVVSFGFLEHFENPLDVTRKQLSMVRPCGYSVIEVPNYLGLHGPLRKVFDRESCRRHNTTLMEPGIIRKLVEDRGFDVLYCDHYKTFGFWSGGGPGSRVIAKFTEPLKDLLEYMYLNDTPNRLFSPYVVCIARRNAD